MRKRNDTNYTLQTLNTFLAKVKLDCYHHTFSHVHCHSTHNKCLVPSRPHARNSRERGHKVKIKTLFVLKVTRDEIYYTFEKREKATHPVM